MRRALILPVLLLASACARPPTATDSDDRVPDTDTDSDTDIDLGPQTERGLYAFLGEQQHPDTGLVESYVVHDDLPAAFASYLRDQRPAFVYDNALAALAWLARPTQEDRERAGAVLDALVGLQRPDGSIPDVVHVQDLTGGDGPASTGNQAWVMLALITGYEQIGEERWLLAAEHIAAYLLDPAHQLQSPNGFGGYRLRSGSTAVSTEHNLDLTSAFQRLAAHLPTSAARLDPAEALLAARRARHFAESRFNPTDGLVFTGSDVDGVRHDASVKPLDTHTWSLLALGRPKWTRSLAWARQTPPQGLWVDSPTCPGVSGPSYSDSDVGEVWAEGLAQLHLAAQLAGSGFDLESMQTSLDVLQRDAPHADGRGLVAACDTLGTGFGSEYFNSLAVGATAWAALASRGVDPFWFRAVDAGLAGHPLADVPSLELGTPPDQRVTCTGDRPCFFDIRGDSTAVAGTDRQIHLLVYPTEPVTVGRFFTQATPASVATDGSWQVQGQLGDGVTPVESGHRMRVVALVVDGAAPALQLSTVTPDTVPDVLTTSGLLHLTVE